MGAVAAATLMILLPYKLNTPISRDLLRWAIPRDWPRRVLQTGEEWEWVSDDSSDDDGPTWQQRLQMPNYVLKWDLPFTF